MGWLHKVSGNIFVAVLLGVGFIALIGTVGVFVGAMAGIALVVTGLINYWTQPKEAVNGQKDDTKK